MEVNPHGDPILQPLKAADRADSTEVDCESVASSDISGVDDNWMSSSLPEENPAAGVACLLPEVIEQELRLPSPPAQTPDVDTLPR